MNIMDPYFEKQTQLLAPYLSGVRTLLDFGCGDVSLLTRLHKRFPNITMTGVDVVDPHVRVPGVTFTLYDGTTLPFRNNAFDVTISYHVLHHTRDPRAAFGEIIRVTKKTILMVEPVYRNRLDLWSLKLTDRIGNGWRRVGIPMPFTFQSEATWRRYTREFHWTVTDTKSVGVFPRWLPIGETKLFVLSHNSNS